MAAHTAKANYRKAWMIQRRINGNRDHYANLTAEDQYLVKTLEPHLVPHPRWHANLRQDARCEDYDAASLPVKTMSSAMVFEPGACCRCLAKRLCLRAST